MGNINFEFHRISKNKPKLKNKELGEFVKLTHNQQLQKENKLKFQAYSIVKDQIADAVLAIQMGDTKHTPSSVNVLVDGKQETWEIKHEQVILERFLNIFDKDDRPIYENNIIRLEKDNSSKLIIANERNQDLFDEKYTLTNLGPIYSEIEIEPN